MISIILPTYCPNEEVEEVLRKFIKTLVQNTYRVVELIVVEQGKQVFEKILNKQIICGYSRIQIADYKYVHYPEPIGYAKAVNIGMGMAKAGEHLFIVNNDLEVPAKWDVLLEDTYRSHPKMGILAPIDQTKTPCAVIAYDDSWWSCVCISKEVWDDVGPLDDEKLNYRFHDQDWNIRAKMKGYDIGRLYSVQVKHIEQTTYKHMNVKKEESDERNEMIRRYGVAHYYEWLLSRPN